MCLKEKKIVFFLERKGNIFPFCMSAEKTRQKDGSSLKIAQELSATVTGSACWSGLIKLANFHEVPDRPTDHTVSQLRCEPSSFTSHETIFSDRQTSFRRQDQNVSFGSQAKDASYEKLLPAMLCWDNNQH